MRSFKKIIYTLIIIFSLLSVFSNNRNIQNNEVDFTSTEGWFFNGQSALWDETNYLNTPNTETFLLEGYFSLTAPEDKEDERVGTVSWMQGDTVLAKGSFDSRSVSNGHANFFFLNDFNGPPGIYSGTNILCELENGITIGGEPGDNSWIDDFKVGKDPALKPTFNAPPTININFDTKVGTVDYSINIPTGDEVTYSTVISKIEITDGNNVYGSISSTNGLPPTGTITTDSLNAGEYNNLYLKATYNGGEVGEVGDINSKIPNFTIAQDPASAPKFITSPTIDIDPVTKEGTVNYDIDIPSGDINKVDTIVTKIEIKDGNDNVYGTSSSTSGLPPTGQIITDSPIPIGTYDDWYLKVTYNDDLIIGGAEGDKSQIEEFIIGQNPVEVPIFNNSPTIEVNDDNTLTVNYDITVPSGDDYTEATVINKIEIKDGNDNVYGTASSTSGLPPTGQITTDSPIPIGTYDDWYLEAYYNGGTIGGAEGDKSQILPFTIEKDSAKAPIFNNSPTIEVNDDNTLTVNYDITIPSGDDYTEATVINKIEITDGQKVFGSIDSSTIEGGIIPPTGSITTNTYLESGSYSDLYLKVTYNNNLTIGGVDGDKSQIEEFTITREPALTPKINSVEITEIKHSKAIVKYNIDIPTGQSTVEDTVVQKIEVIDNKDGKIYGSIEVKSKSEVSSIEETGEIELQGLDSKTVYNELYLSITYNGNEGMPIGSIEDSHIVPFTTKVNWTIIYGSIIALSIILILIIIILLVLVRRKKFKIEKKYHIQKR